MKHEKSELLREQYFSSATNFMKMKGYQHINVSLGNGLTGVAVTYLYNDRSKEFNRQYELAESILHTVRNKVRELELSTDLYSGVLGTVLGLCYLIRTDCIACSENEFVRDFDSRIYQIVTTDYNRRKEAFNCTSSKLNMLFYLIVRMDKMRKTEKVIFEDVIIKLINDIYDDLQGSTEDESLVYENLLKSHFSYFLCLLAKTYSLGFYNTRILHVLDEYRYKVFSRKPLLHSNRLVLLFAANEICRSTGQKQWKEFVHELRGSILLEKILTYELNKNQIFFSDGIGSIYLMLSHYNKYNDEKFELNNEYFYNRIANSELWKEVDPDSAVFRCVMSLDGFGGLTMLLEYITKQMKDA